jgi:hypothetical protein
MSYPLSMTGEHFLKTGAIIARDTIDSGPEKMSNTLNRALFNGGALAPKSFKQLFSFNDPCSKVLTLLPESYEIVLVEEKMSFSAFLGYLEAIPFLGTVFALIHLIVRLFFLAASYNSLKSVSKEMLASEENADSPEKIKKVFEHAIDYTFHRNYLIGSALSLVPFMKPLTRFIQGMIYYYQSKTPTAPIPQKTNPSPLKHPSKSEDFLDSMEWSKAQWNLRHATKREELRRNPPKKVLRQRTEYHSSIRRNAQSQGTEEFLESVHWAKRRFEKRHEKNRHDLRYKRLIDKLSCYTAPAI